MRTSLKRVLTACVIALAVAVAGCNTVQGFGKDMQAAGKTIDKTADNVKHNLNDQQ